MQYLTLDDVLFINDQVVGPYRVRDVGLVEAAVLRPQTTVGGLDAFEDIHAKAAALFESLARHHGFLDGNKRTAVVALVTFYRLNGWRLDAEQGEMYALVLGAAEGLHDVPMIAGTLKRWAHETWPEGTEQEIEVTFEGEIDP